MQPGGLAWLYSDGVVSADLLVIVPVDVADRGYDVTVGPGARHRLPDVVRRVLGDRPGRAVVITQAAVGVDVDTGVPTTRIEVPVGEAAKSMSQVETVCRRFAEIGLSRRDVVVAVGGGVVSDLAGFAAAIYHRGVAYVTVATTLLAQVDAAIGGKTGVNLPEGKNLVGAFWQPSAVLCDTETLVTLPRREWASGRGEMAKYAFLGCPAGPPEPGDRPAGQGAVDDLLALDLTGQVARCVQVKAAVVAADEREGDRRMVLNYGHTLAHALETAAFGQAPRWDIRHGEAVAIGLVFAAVLARRMGRIDDHRVADHRKVIEQLGLPGALPPGAEPDELVALMARDKKADHDLTFVLDGPRGVEPVHGVDPDEVRGALLDMQRAERSGLSM